MLTIAEYCKTRYVSQTAIRRQLKRYADDLKGHIIESKRGMLLDDKAVDFLDTHRRPRDVIIQQADEEAQKEVQELKLRLERMKDQILSLQGNLLQLKDENHSLIAQKAKTELLIELRETEIGTLQDKLDESMKTSIEMSSKIIVTEKELEFRNEELKARTKELETRTEELKATAKTLEEVEARAKAEKEDLETIVMSGKEKLETMTKELEAKKEEAEEARKEVGRFKKSLFGFYRRT